MTTRTGADRVNDPSDEMRRIIASHAQGGFEGSRGSGGVVNTDRFPPDTKVKKGVLGVLESET